MNEKIEHEKQTGERKIKNDGKIDDDQFRNMRAIIITK